MTERTGYVVLDEDWDDQRRLDMTYAILDVLVADIAQGDFWIEWYIADQWPEDVRAAAERLRDRFSSAKDRTEDLYFTADLDGEVKDDCLLVAPFAHDVQLLGAGPGRRSRRMVAALHDENSSNVFSLTAPQRAQVEAIVGAQNLRTLEEHHRLRSRPSRRGR